jgi:hypothetical protein
MCPRRGRAASLAQLRLRKPQTAAAAVPTRRSIPVGDAVNSTAGSADRRCRSNATCDAGLLAISCRAFVAAAGAFVVRRIRGGRRTRVDLAGRHLGRGRDIEATSRAAVTAMAKRLGVIADNPGGSSAGLLPPAPTCTAPTRT